MEILIVTGLIKGPEELEIGGRAEAIKIGQNTKKSPGDSKRLAVTRTPVENHQ